MKKEDEEKTNPFWKAIYEHANRFVWAGIGTAVTSPLTVGLFLGINLGLDKKFHYLEKLNLTGGDVLKISAIVAMGGFLGLKRLGYKFCKSRGLLEEYK